MSLNLREKLYINQVIIGDKIISYILKKYRGDILIFLSIRDNLEKLTLKILRLT